MNAEVPARQPPAAAGEDLAAPRIEDNLVRAPQTLTPISDGDTIPVLEAAPAPRPWYRRRPPLLAVIAAAAVLLGGLAAALVLTVFAPSGPADPASVLQADGYPLMMSLTPDQMAQFGAFSGSNAAARPYISHVVIGEKGRYAELVYSLTPAGQARAKASLGDFGSNIMGIGGTGVTWHMTSGDLVVNGPSSALNGTSPQGT